MLQPKARFAVGQLIRHKLFGYRGVIFDVDPQFRASDEWYEQVARTRPPKDAPWYRVMVDGQHYETYVAERNLEEDDLGTPIDHPLVEDLFGRFEYGRYALREPAN
jgi:heat shock protein HspQ